MKKAIQYSKLLGCSAAVLMLAACSGTKSEAVVELTKSDKHMDCSQLQLEITEAEFFRNKAERNRGLSLKNVAMPLGYPSTYLSASKAVEAATGRVAYLTQLYEIKGCGSQQMAGGYAGGQNEMGYGYGHMPAAGQHGRMYQPMQYQQPMRPQQAERPLYSSAY